MSGTVFEKTASTTTFADEIEYVSDIDPEKMDTYEADLSEVTKEEFEQVVEDANKELAWGKLAPLENKAWESPDTKLRKLEQTVAVLAETTKTGLSELFSTVNSLSRSVESICNAVEGLHNMVKEADESLNEVEDEDLDTYQPKKKGSPGRPVKEPPKIAVPKKQKPKIVAKKVVKTKPKAVKKKTKRR